LPTASSFPAELGEADRACDGRLEVLRAHLAVTRVPEHVVADELASGELVALQVPEFEVGVMELFAVRRRDRAFGVVASALWEEISRSGAEAAGVMHARKRGRGKRTDTNRRSLNNSRRR
jgi:hypothetical protein